MNTDGSFEFGGPWKSVEELQRAYPSIGDVALDIRRECVRSPLYLGHSIIQHDRKALLANPCEGHRRAEKAMVEQRNFLLLLPRGHLKTTVVDEIGTIWQLLRYPNDRILLMQASLENAKAIAGQVRQHFMVNPKLRYFFPEYAMNGKDEEGNILKFSVPCKRVVTREESVEIGTPGASLSGRHYDVIAASDLMNEQTTPPPCGNATAEEMMKVISWYATVDGLLESKMVNPRAHKRMDATPWHDADLSAEIETNNTNGRWEIIKYGVTRGDDGRFVAVWDEFTSEMLHEKYESPTMTPYLWAANYAMEPKAEGGAIRMEREHFKAYTEAPPGLQIAITVDPAWTDKRKRGASRSDRSAMVVSGVAPGSGRLYVLDILAGRWGPKELVEAVFAKAEYWKPSWVGFEQDDKGLKAIWMMELQRNKRFIPYRTLKCGSKDKEQRAAPLIHLAAQWGVYVRKGVHDPLVEECVRFPVGKHDDFVDALAYRAMDVLVPFGARDEDEDEENKRRESLGSGYGGRIITADVIRRQLARAKGAGDSPWTRTMKELNR